jgi:hypothetical protein
MKNKYIIFSATFFGPILFFLLYLIFFVNTKDVRCDLQADRTYTCDIRNDFLDRYPLNYFTRHIEHVVSITMTETVDEGVSYRAEFVTSDGKQVPLMETYTDYGPVSKQVDAIGPQLAAHAAHIAYRAEPIWWAMYLVGGLCLMLMFFAPLNLLRNHPPQDSPASGDNT